MSVSKSDTISKLFFTTCIQIGQYVAMAKFLLFAINIDVLNADSTAKIFICLVLN